MSVDTSNWIVCDSCGHPYPPAEACDNPCCFANPSLSDEHKQRLAQQRDAELAKRKALAERQRLYAKSFERAS